MLKQKYVFECEKICRSYRTEGRELWALTVRARNLPRTFKLGPNARYASLDSKPAREMLDTLEREPASFVFKNNGMMLVAESIKPSGESVEIFCNEAETDDEMPGHGVLNGGHTYLCLQHALANPGRFKDAAEFGLVVLTVGIGIPDEEIWKISRPQEVSACGNPLARGVQAKRPERQGR